MRVPFVVGRLTPKSSEMVVVKNRRGPKPFPGPWSLRAIVRRTVPVVETLPLSATVH